MQQDNKPTSSDPFQEWVRGEVVAIVAYLRGRGIMPSQAGYVLAIALGELLYSNDRKLAIHLPLLSIGAALRPHAEAERQAIAAPPPKYLN